MFATSATWAEVLGWYRSTLEPLGWRGREIKPSTWWRWTSPGRPGEKIEMLEHGRWEQLPGWPLPEEQVGQLGFEVIFTARGPFSASVRSPDA